MTIPVNRLQSLNAFLGIFVKFASEKSRETPTLIDFIAVFMFAKSSGLTVPVICTKLSPSLLKADMTLAAVAPVA